MDNARNPFTITTMGRITYQARAELRDGDFIVVRERYEGRPYVPGDNVSADGLHSIFQRMLGRIAAKQTHSLQDSREYEIKVEAW
ncbi:MAG: hypothetical protein HZA95_02930 [Candidatus Vogelbacteria bacterium]|nr:hypothetical protein [Candidatus Vogelbacteria bacterium]